MKGEISLWKAHLLLLLLVYQVTYLSPVQSSKLNGIGTDQQNLNARWFELKFQNELDNSALIKSENQNQIFKCQVRLAPIAVGRSFHNNHYKRNHNHHHENLEQQIATERASKFKSEREPIEISHEDLTLRLLSGLDQQHDGGRSNNNNDNNNNDSLLSPLARWPTDVTLTIDWVRNNQTLSEWLGGAHMISTINLELKSNNNNSSNNNISNQAAFARSSQHLIPSTTINRTQTNSWFTDKRHEGIGAGGTGTFGIGSGALGPNSNNINKAARIEIKNTLNGAQLKLTSRLKINQLRSNDSGHFKCIARANFILAWPNSEKTASSPSNANIGSAKPPLLEGWLEKPNNATTVGNANANNNTAEINMNEAQQQTSPTMSLFRIKQSLESNGAILMITPPTNTNSNAKRKLSSKTANRPASNNNNDNELETTAPKSEILAGDSVNKIWTTMNEEPGSGVKGRVDNKAIQLLAESALENPSTDNSLDSPMNEETSSTPSIELVPLSGLFRFFTGTTQASQASKNGHGPKLVLKKQAQITPINGIISKTNNNHQLSATKVSSPSSGSEDDELDPNHSQGEHFGNGASNDAHNYHEQANEAILVGTGDHTAGPLGFAGPLSPSRSSSSSSSMGVVAQSRHWPNALVIAATTTNDRGMAIKGADGGWRHTTMNDHDDEQEQEKYNNKSFDKTKSLLEHHQGSSPDSRSLISKATTSLDTSGADGEGENNHQDADLAHSDRDIGSAEEPDPQGGGEKMASGGKDSKDASGSLGLDDRDAISKSWRQLIQMGASGGLDVTSGQSSFPSAWDSTKTHFVKFFQHSRFQLTNSASLMNPDPTSASCYTGFGEHYAGNVSESADKRVCINWLLVTRSLEMRPGFGLNKLRLDDKNDKQEARQQLESYHLNHNRCRNPNNNKAGPWCYVRYSHFIDGPLSSSSLSLSTNDDNHQLIFVARECNLSPCSRYLWLYIVAPPLGLLAFLLIAFVMSVRSIRRRSYYKGCLRSMSKAVLPNRLHKISIANGSSRNNNKKLNKKVVAAKHKHYYDNSKIVDDKQRQYEHLSELMEQQSEVGSSSHETNWSLACGQEMSSPGSSGQEFMNLNDSPISIDSKTNRKNKPHMQINNDNDRSNNTSSYRRSKSHIQLQAGRKKCPGLASKPKASHLYSTEKLLDISSSTTDFTFSSSSSSASQHLVNNGVHHEINTNVQQSCSSGPNNNNRLNRQNGPIFATLRCNLRSKSNHHILEQLQQNSSNSSSPFELMAKKNNINHYGTSKRKAPPHLAQVSSDNPISSMDFSVMTTNHRHRQHNQQLISCSTTLDDIEPIAIEGEVAANPFGLAPFCSKSTSAIDLPRLDTKSITIDATREPIFEGKFSQVQWGHWNRQHVKQANNNNKNNDEQQQSTTKPISETTVFPAKIKDIGLSVAIHSMKVHQAGSSLLDSRSPFDISLLEVRNLNHLNLIKLIGIAIFDIDDKTTNPKSSLNSENNNSMCSLIYDMSQLVDFNDWLKQQNRNLMASGEEESQELGLRRNLTCLAKQIALALDYLHDQDIVFKDLACRNCFIDPTKMIIKLTTFNHEPLINQRIKKNHCDQHYNPNENNNNQQIQLNNNNNDCPQLSMRQVQQNLSLKSMIRPKYLLDYYVIDSRPSDSQMLPLSWIPLESILFNKFNRQTDIWSFGCLLYELFTLGEVAFFGYSCKQIIDAIRANLMPPQPRLCPNGIYRLMCNCLSDIPTIRPNVKQIYEQLNLFSGQCTSFLDHHLCSLATDTANDN